MAADVGGATRLAGVLGWPVSHSRSPQMHNAAYAALGLDWVYVPLAVPPDRLPDALRGLSALGFAGVNVTIPHKQAVAALCDRLSDEATQAGSVNTVLVEREGRLRGETTDGGGLLDALGAPLPATAAVLGGGGAARAAVAALVAAGLMVSVCARRADAAGALASLLGAAAVPWPYAGDAELIVNATPIGQSGDQAALPVDQALLEPGRVVCDLAYRADGAETALIAAAARRGARAVDGLEVLVGQGARAFRLFTGSEPPLDVMRAAVRSGR